MSNVFYPIGLITEIDPVHQDRTLNDEFENGTTAARAYWAAQNFKRTFQITHAPLKPSEFKFLKSFYSQRSGQFDPFWYRDNIGRGGNALVRYATPLAFERAGQVITLGKTFVNLAEVAPIRALPEFDELTAAAGFAPLLWYDANREYYLQHAGAVILDSVNATFDVMGNYRAAWQSGSQLNLGNALGQYQSYNFTGVESALTPVISQLTGAKPAVTIFLLAKISTVAAQQVLLSIGTSGSGNAFGLGISSSNNFGLWQGAILGGSVANAGGWISHALSVGSGSNTASYYQNAAFLTTIAPTRNTVNPVASLGCDTGGTNLLNPSNALANCSLAHALVFNGALSLAQIKAVHNLLGYQYGLSIVP